MFLYGTDSKYDEGFAAAEHGKEFYENPYMLATSNTIDGLTWFAGWCFGKQVIEGK